MTQDSISCYDVESRMRQLESSNRRLQATSRVMVFVIVALAICFHLTHKDTIAAASAGRSESDKSSVIQARALEIVDKAGEVMIRLSANHGQASLWMRDEKGKKRITLGMVRHGTSAPTDSPWLAFHNRNGGTPVILSCSDLNRPYMVFRDADGKNRIGLSVWDGVPPYIKIYDEKGTAVWQAP